MIAALVALASVTTRADDASTVVQSEARIRMKAELASGKSVTIRAFDGDLSSIGYTHAPNKIAVSELEEHYRKRSLLQRSVFPEDIAEGVVRVLDRPAQANSLDPEALQRRLTSRRDCRGTEAGHEPDLGRDLNLGAFRRIALQPGADHALATGRE